MKKAHRAGRLLLETILKEKGLPAEVGVDERFGFIYLQNRRSVYVNIAHTREGVVAGVAPAPIGIDIEAQDRKNVNTHKRIAEPEEIKEVEERYSSQSHFVHPHLILWVAKEAVAKASGLGIRYDLKQCRIYWHHVIASQKHNAIFPVGEWPKEAPYHLNSPGVVIKAFKDYIVGVCTEAPLLEAEINFLDRTDRIFHEQADIGERLTL